MCKGHLQRYSIGTVRRSVKDIKNCSSGTQSTETLMVIVNDVALLLISGVSSLQCYQCLINPPPGQYYNTTKRLCVHFDHSDKFIVECPYSTMCMKQEFHLDIQNGGMY